MPLGPVIQSHDRLAKSFKREVIDKRPDEFKVETLNEIGELFS